jgi:uncharacterized protein YjiS (DUF1127 family)
MSATLSNIVRSAGTTSPGGTLGVFGACFERITRYLVHRAAITGLSELDEHALQDIGIARSQIEAAVRGFIAAPSRGRT